ncbi:MAG: hypothetical protein WCH32_13625 [Pseudomonadota bacterium]
MDTPALLRILRREFRLDWHGIHGAAHWARVRANGRALAALTGARVDVVEAFAWVHDSQRHDDGRDPAHGLRAARWAETVNDTLLFLDGDGLALLTSACTDHSRGLREADITVQTCWDADRLDLGRIGIRPDPRRLCTVPAACDPELLEWAYQRSKRIPYRWEGSAVEDADVDGLDGEAPVA